MKILENSIIKLRDTEPKDIDFLFNTENDTDLWEISNTVKPFSKYVLKQYIETSHLDIFTVKQVRFIIETLKDKKSVGLAELFDYEPVHMRAGIGIHIIKDEQRKGYAKQALSLLIRYCGEVLRLNQIYCNISVDNTASIKLFEKAGFKLSGKKEQWLNTKYGFKDVLFYQLLLR